MYSLVLLVLCDGSEEVRVLLLLAVAGDGALGAVGDDHGLEVLRHSRHGLDGVRARRTLSKNTKFNYTKTEKNKLYFLIFSFLVFVFSVRLALAKALLTRATFF